MTAIRAEGRGGATSGTALLLCLSCIAGMVDVTSFVLLNGVFTAHITGNIVVLAADVAMNRHIEAISAVAVVEFITITAILAAIVDVSARAPFRWARGFLGLQFNFLTAAAFAAVILHASGKRGPGVNEVVAVLAVAAMASQNALLHLTLKRAPSTAVMTGNTVAATAALVGLLLQRHRRLIPTHSSGQVHDRSSDEAEDRAVWHRMWPALLGFASGCALGAAASETLRWWAWAAPALVSCVYALLFSDDRLSPGIRRER